MTTLPDCIHRGAEVSEGRYACACNWLIHSKGSASAETCRKCPYPQRKNRRFQFGDWAASLFRKIGVRMKRNCGCYARQQKLNRWGDTFARLLSTLRATANKIRGKEF